MSIEEYRNVAFGWAILMVFLTVFWYFTLRRLSEILKQHLKETRSRQAVPEGLLGVFVFLFRGDYNETGDDRLVGACRRLRQLLYGYIGGVGAFFVFIVIFRPHI